MRQTLFYLPTEIFGAPLFGKGILFWLVLLVGIFSVARALIHHKRLDDSIFYACVTALGLFLVSVVGPRIVENGGFPIRGYGVCLTLAIVLSGALTVWRGKKWNYPPELIVAIVFVSALFGIVGARVFYILQYWRDIQAGSLRETLISAIDITNGGLVVYGSIIGGFIACNVFLFVKKLPVLATLDLFAPSLALGIAIGRIGCLMNGCCFGGPCDLSWGVVFPPESPAYVEQTNEGVISLYGITLALPEDKDAPEKTLFSLKSKHVHLATEAYAPVFVAAVDPGSEAEAAGILPGSQICEMGLVPKGMFADEDLSKINRKKIRRFVPQNNAQVFYFFQNMWNNDPEQDVFLTIMDPQNKNDENATADATQNNGAPTPASLRNIVFHPAPAVAKPVHPTQIYSSIGALIICGLLLLLSKFAKKDGLVCAGMLMLYPIHRFIIEMIRSDEESFCGTGLTVSQCVSIGVELVGVGILLYSLFVTKKRALDGFFPVKTVEVEEKKA